MAKDKVYRQVITRIEQLFSTLCTRQLADYFPIGSIFEIMSLLKMKMDYVLKKKRNLRSLEFRYKNQAYFNERLNTFTNFNQKIND